MASATAGQSIVVVSNRLPVTLHRSSAGLEIRRSSGGLVSAVEPALQRRGGTWVGWLGTALRPHEVLPSPENYAVRAVPLSERDVAGFYHGLSNGTLWPLFHCFPTRTHFDRQHWEAYERANERFAETTIEASAGASLVWIHDYHLMLTPLRVRQRLRDKRIAFFLHIPFPPYDIFRLLPWDRDLLRGLLACDLVGFHVQDYALNFLDCAERLLGARVDRNALLVEHGDRVVQVGIFPLGIDFELFQQRARNARPGIHRTRFALGVDRLDYTKGIPERILAFERLLELHPEHREKVILLQLAVPSRSQVGEYRHLKRQIDELVGRVNGRWATAHWTPIHYLYQSMTPSQLAGHYRDADVALVTPLRDGMNLVAKEFVASQVDKPGVLVLSRLAGAGATMHGALLVNPYNVDETAAAIHRALSMDDAERRSRLVALRRRERRYDLYWWLDRILAAAFAAPAGLRPAADIDFEGWLRHFLEGYRLALFLDYDGTVTPHVDRPEDAALPPVMRAAIETCVGRPDTGVAVVSGRTLSEIRAMVDLPGITYVGDHGLNMFGPDIEDFHHPDVEAFALRIPALADALDQIAPAGAFAEKKGAHLTFHFRRVDESKRPALIARARELITAAGFEAREAHSAIEARPPIAWDKGQAVLHILRSRHGPQWSESIRPIYIGDDQTDEDAFRVLTGLGVTFRVGNADTPTSASHRLANVEAVLALLDWLGRRPTSDTAIAGVAPP